MEKVLHTYKLAYDPLNPVVCMDEQPKQLLADTREAIPMKARRPSKIDYEYRREGTCSVWMFTEPLGGFRKVEATGRRTAVDWARQVKALVNLPRYGRALKITLVMDNLNTHDVASLYKAFEPAEAFRIASKLDIVPTPVHGSWLNMAELELSALTRQCLGGRVPSLEEVRVRCKSWESERNRRQTGIDWHFTVDSARTLLKCLYPKINVC